MSNDATSDDALTHLAKSLVENGTLRPEQVRLWSFPDLYLADPADLSPSERRSQLEYRNSIEFAELRRQHGFT